MTPTMVSTLVPSIPLRFPLRLPLQLSDWGSPRTITKLSTPVVGAAKYEGEFIHTAVAASLFVRR